MKIRNYTTTKTVSQTIQDIQKVLIANGAKNISIEYDDGIAEAVIFSVNTPNGIRGIKLPCEWVKMRTALREAAIKNEIRIPKGDLFDYSKRVAWRQIYHWIDAQLALMATQMVKLEQIFLPYMVNRSGKTFFEVIENNGYQLPDKS